MTFAILFLAIALPAYAGEVEVKATLEPAVIGIDQTATFTIEVRGEGVSSLRFRPSLQLENLEDAGGPSQFEDMRWTNGHFTRTFRLSWQLRPQGLGKAGVHNVIVQIQDKQMQLPDREIRVQKEPTAQAPSLRNRDDEDDPFKQFFGHMPVPRWRTEQPKEPAVFLRAEMQPQQPVPGQQVLYTIYLFTREDIANIAPAGLPAFKGFWVQDIPVPQHPPMEMVEFEGRRYGRVALIQKALFPLRAGAFAIEGATLDLTVEHYDRSFFFGPAISRPETVRLRTEGQTLTVQPLPPAPPGFTGAVGQLTLTARLEPQKLRLGEAATLTVQLGGTGYLQGLPEPAVTAPAGLTLYPPQREGKDEIAGTTVRGRRSWSYVVVPGRTGNYRLEAPRVPYFDPVSREYRTATAPALELTALPRPTVGPIGAIGAMGSSEPHPVHAAAINPKNPGGRQWARLLPWFFAVPSGLALVFLLLRRRSFGDPAAKGPAAARLEQVLAEVATERPRQVATRLEEAWRDFLAERWGIPHSTPAAKWSAVLARYRVDGASLVELDSLLDELDYLRHAPQLSTTDTLVTEALGRCRRLLRRLQ
ncbi:MAG TPA: BatD family protein [Thermoanaerobaculia bacterium]|nr:BatD family protein [Thermoanaerobaculia bacterium]